MGSNLFNFKFMQKTATNTKPAFSASNSGNKLYMSDETFIDLRNVIYKKSGIFYSDSKKYLLEGRISKRLIANDLASFEDYVQLIKNSPSKDELNKLFDVITINETYFFRAEQQFEAFQNIVAPEILKHKKSLKKSTFRIWSAASSSGEEAYTIALIIAEKIQPLYPDVQFQIVASDISNSILETAKKGVFKEYSVRNIPPLYMNKYFKKNANNYILSQNIRNMVRFVNINLYDPIAIRSISSCDVIFCANVLIYFDIPSKQKVVSSLYDALNPNGYLFIGYSESLHGISKAFKLIHLPKAMAYKKE